MASKKLGFKEARRRVCEALKDPKSYVHDPRIDQAKKNLLASGQVTPEEVLAVLIAAKGQDHTEEPHHEADLGNIHVVTCQHQGVEWYIKWYFIDETHFISVHH